jgi:hypothetical protein
MQVLPDLIRFWDTLFSVESGDRQTFFVAATVACVLVANNEGLLVYNDFADIMRYLQRGLQVRPRLVPPRPGPRALQYTGSVVSLADLG